MENYQRYKYLGYTYPATFIHWQPIILEMLRKMDKHVRPWYIPLPIMNSIKWLGMGNSVVSVKNWFWYNLSRKLTKGNFITDIKDKYAELCVYGYFDEEMDKIVEWAENECSMTCEKCGSREDVQCYGERWVYNYCEKCRLEKKQEIIKK